MLIKYLAFDFIIKITCALSMFKLQMWRATNYHSCQWNTDKVGFFFNISRYFQSSQFIFHLGTCILKDILGMMLWFIWRWVWVFNDSIGLCWAEIFSPNRLKNEKMENINIFHEIFGVNCNKEEKVVVILASSFTSQVKNTKFLLSFGNIWAFPQ